MGKAAAIARASVLWEERREGALLQHAARVVLPRKLVHLPAGSLRVSRGGGKHPPNRARLTAACCTRQWSMPSTSQGLSLRYRLLLVEGPALSFPGSVSGRSGSIAAAGSLGACVRGLPSCSRQVRSNGGRRTIWTSSILGAKGTRAKLLTPAASALGARPLGPLRSACAALAGRAGEGLSLLVSLCAAPCRCHRLSPRAHSGPLGTPDSELPSSASCEAPWRVPTHPFSLCVSSPRSSPFGPSPC